MLTEREIKKGENSRLFDFQGIRCYIYTTLIGTKIAFL
jgi:hypothetical protein